MARHDKALAEKLCDLQAGFWAPSSTWSWNSTSGSNRAGWMVQAISHREEDSNVLLNVRSLHHSDHHKYGDIRVTSSHGRSSIRSIIQLHGAREREGGLRISLSATEIGDPTAYLLGRETSPYPGNVSVTYRNSVGSISQAAERTTALSITTYPSGDFSYVYVRFTGQTQ